MINPKKIFGCRTNPIDYTNDQKKALLLVQTFLHNRTELFFLLSGNAGTGKTTIAENIALYANAHLLAPTNAAVQRLMDKCSGMGSLKFSTIHAELYGAPDPFTGEYRKKNGLAKRTVYIVDEASMIDKKVMDDLILEAIAKSTKLIFLGDDFQLEPVGKDPKLFNWEMSSSNFNPDWKIKLNEVKRTEGNILTVCTHLRNNTGVQILNMDTEDFSIVERFSQELPLDIAHDKYYVVLVSTNKTRIQYNRHIRNAKYEEDAQEPFNDGERLISVANQQFSNGECYTIKHPKLIEYFDEQFNGGSKQYPKMVQYKMYLIEHEVAGRKGSFKTLLIPSLDMPSLHGMQIMTEPSYKFNNNLTKMGKRWRNWDPSVNIATYGYAISVHKSQGNEWDNVYIDGSWLSDAWSKGRWFYTALTRAKKKVELKMSNQFTLVDE
jgi:tRNA A37 threonylcarbamoyladenosine biosynthesis protein TsaE